MKETKITITVLILILIVGCLNNIKASGSGNNSTCVYADGSECQVHLIKVRGHEYLISYTSRSYGGTCIIHAAHCHCQTNNPKYETR